MNNFISIANPQRELSKIPKFYEDFNKQLKSGVFVGGKNLDLLEKSLANFLKVNYCSTLNSGTDALILSLIALDIGPGDEVIVPSFTYFATVGAVLQVNATPVFADIEKDSFCISLNTIKKLVTKKTKCIIPVHLYGYDADIRNIINFAKNNNIKVIEDTAQAFGSKSEDNNYLGTSGDINAFSNFPSKTLGGIGDGGFITTNSKTLYEKINMLKNHGQVEKYNHEILGRNSRLDSLNAYVLNEKLKIFNQISKSRIEFTNFYIKIFEDVDFIKINKFSKNTLLNYFTVLLPKNIRNEFKDELNRNGIEANIYYDKPIHLQNVIIDSNTTLKNNNLVNTENAKLEALTLPLYPFPLKQELQHIKKNLNKLIDQYRNIKL